VSCDSIHGLTRREWLSASLLSSGALLVGFEKLPRWQNAAATDAFASGQFLGTVPFAREGSLPVDTLLGEELDGRLYTDLAQLASQDSVTPTDRFYVRTRASRLLDRSRPWRIRISGAAQAADLGFEQLQQGAQPCGLHLMECAGNSREARFGMISVADWTGVPIQTVLERFPATAAASRVLISGFDEYAGASQTSVPGASWIFSSAELRSARAFLATQMNGQPLTADHGAPVRLVVPGWYGCVSIKWVNEIALVDDSAAATSQMTEYAARTQQTGSPALARDFSAATIDAAALPIRVEKWLVHQRIRYRVAGILWGGSKPVTTLEIRFNPEEDFVRVESFRQAANDPWSFWTHSWAPSAPGRYLIRLRVAAPQVRTRRLDAGFYVRAVDITEV
jgi:DMSO/TMAO reductase YedYZ molybdopterin-dependent catalytic subunit